MADTFLRAMGRTAFPDSPPYVVSCSLPTAGQALEFAFNPIRLDTVLMAGYTIRPAQFGCRCYVNDVGDVGGHLCKEGNLDSRSHPSTDGSHQIHILGEREGEAAFEEHLNNKSRKDRLQVAMSSGSRHITIHVYNYIYIHTHTLLVAACLSTSESHSPFPHSVGAGQVQFQRISSGFLARLTELCPVFFREATHHTGYHHLGGGGGGGDGCLTMIFACWLICLQIWTH